MMIYAAAGQCFCYLMITVLIRHTEIPSYPEEKQAKIASASIAFFFLYYVFFGIGWQGVPVWLGWFRNVPSGLTDFIVVISNRNQLSQYENQRSCHWYRNKLDLQLYGHVVSMHLRSRFTDSVNQLWKLLLPASRAFNGNFISSGPYSMVHLYRSFIYSIPRLPTVR